MQLTALEQGALKWLKDCGGSVVITMVEDKPQVGLWNEVVIPSKRTIQSLIKKGVVIQTEEEGDWTPTYDLVEEGGDEC